MKKAFFICGLFVVVNVAAMPRRLIEKCEKTIIDKNEQSDRAALDEKKRACRKDPAYQICLHQGLKQYWDSGTLIPLDHLQELERSCASKPSKKP